MVGEPVPWIIDYQLVLDQMRMQKLKCNYYNSGAFGFPDSVPTEIVGWIGPPDSTIRAEMQALARPVAEPYEENLSKLAVRAWAELLSGRAWVMPASHWAFELDHGSREWMVPLLERIGVDPGMLASRNNAAAIEFSPNEADLFQTFVQRLLEMLRASDFTIAFPNRPVVAHVHHHKQVWWMTSDVKLAEGLCVIV